MFARLVEILPKYEKKEELIVAARKEILPILKKQHGFLEFLPLIPENKIEKVLVITLWTEKYEAEKYAREVFPRIEAILKPFLEGPIVVKMFEVETTLCERLVETLTAGV